MVEITIEALEALPGKKRIIDIRSRDDFARGSYPGSENIPFAEFVPEHFSPEEPIYLLCHSGIQSLELAEDMTDAGYQAISIHGGYRRFLQMELQKLASDENKAKERQHKRAPIWMITATIAQACRQ